MDTKKIIERIDKLLGEYSILRKKCQYDDFSGDDDGVSEAEKKNFSVRAVAAIEAVAPKGSPYINQAYTGQDREYVAFPQFLVGILQALKTDIEEGHLWNINELINAEIFSDFLEMSKYLLEEGYKDPSAVLIGGVLEEHIRKLCVKNNIDIEIIKGAKKEFKKATAMNDDLKRQGICGNLEHKSVTAWLELRNNAAHGKYDEYGKDQVQIMLAGVRDFIMWFPA